MALPNPIYVSPSTTFVQVDPLQSPYTPVILNAVVYPGQVVSVLDATSSFGVLTTPIVVSTLSTTSFSDGSISTVINQPQGFLTAQTLTTNSWTFLNSFPFRNQYLSAGVQNLTTSTLYTALGYTVQEYVSSLVVSNLTVTGNFLQNKGITITTNLSSFGTVDFTSSVTVAGNTYLSSALSTIGAVNLFSTLHVDGNLFTKSSINTLSSVFVSGPVLAVGSLFTPSLRLQGGLTGVSINILQQTPGFFNVAGNTAISGSLSTLSSFSMGGPLQANFLTVNQNATFLRSADLNQHVSVRQTTSTTKGFSTLGSFGVGNLLTVGLDIEVKDRIFAQGSGFIQGVLTIGSTLIASTIQANVLESYGDYSNLNTVAQISSAFVQGNLGAGMVFASTTTIGGSMIANTLAVNNSLYDQNNLTVLGGLSSLSYVSVGKSVSIEGTLSTMKSVDISSNLIVSNTTRVFQSTSVNLQGGNSSTIGNLDGNGNLICDNTLTIGTITLPANLTAFDFTAKSMAVGTYGYFSTASLPKIVTSSITIGYIPQSEYSFDISGSILLGSNIFLSSPLISTSEYSVGAVSSQLIVRGGFGVGVEPQVGTFESKPIGYFLTSTLSVFSTLSTAAVIATDTITGSLIGDASQMTGFNYPANISVNQVFVSQEATIYEFENSYLRASSLQTSSFTNIGSIFAQSSIAVGSFNIWGNASNIQYNQGYNILQTSPPSSLLVINDVEIYGNTTETVQRRVAINQDYNPALPFSTTLGVYNDLATEGLLTDFYLYVDRYNARKVVVSTLYGYGGDPILLDNTKLSYKYTGFGDTYVSSGKISLNGSQFFVGESATVDLTQNSVYADQTGLQFQSTLFITDKRVGINNAEPNYNLDVNRIWNKMNMYGDDTSVVNNQISITPFLSTQFYAFLSNDPTYCNVVYSPTLTNWSNANNLYVNARPTVYRSYFSAGLSRSNFPSFDLPENILPQAFLGTATNTFGDTTEYLAAISFPNNAFGNSASILIYLPPDTMQSMATNGYTYVAVATTNPSSNVYASKIWYSQSEANITSQWNATDSNIFPPWGRSNGGYDVAYGGMKTPLWIAVGAGSNVSAYKSSDAVNWSSLTTNVDELRAIITYSLPTSGTTVFLATGGYLNGGLITDGVVITTSNEGAIWTNASTYLFTGSGTCLATDGQKVVVGGEDSGGNTLWYSYINESNSYSWSLCQGSLFSTRTNSVLWNGTSWFAAGNTGLLQSSNGITWTTVTTPFTSEIINIGYTSNAATTMGVGPENLLFQESPFLECQNLLSSGTVSFYPSSILHINSACILDERQNMIVPGPITSISPLFSTSYTSTFYTPTAYISSILSTNLVQVGGYYLGIASV
jgi:hypothetical protein